MRRARAVHVGCTGVARLLRPQSAASQFLVSLTLLLMRCAVCGRQQCEQQRATQMFIDKLRSQQQAASGDGRLIDDCFDAMRIKQVKA